MTIFDHSGEKVGRCSTAAAHQLSVGGARRKIVRDKKWARPGSYGNAEAVAGIGWLRFDYAAGYGFLWCENSTGSPFGRSAGGVADVPVAPQGRGA